MHWILSKRYSFYGVSVSGKMPLQCRFNSPSDKISEEEYIQYIYAMLLWRLQDGMGLSFEVASMSLWPFRNNIVESIFRYRSEVNINDPDQLKDKEESLWDELHPLEDEIEHWIFKNAARFQGIKYGGETFKSHSSKEEPVIPEFNYYD